MQLHKCSCVPLPVNLGCSNTVGQSDFQSHFSLEIKVGEMLTQKIFACIYYLWYMCFIFSYFYFLWFSDRYLNCSHLTLNVLPWILWDLLETLPPNSFPQGPPVEPQSAGVGSALSCFCGGRVRGHGASLGMNLDQGILGFQQDKNLLERGGMFILRISLILSY